MSVPDVVLVGYYGRANFGDDVLMLAAHGEARKLVPQAKIGLRLDPSMTYPARLLRSEIVAMPFGTRDRHRLIVHGGGGTFFDFAPQGFSARARNAALLALGAGTYVWTDAALRNLVNRPRMSAKTRLGLGLGIGTFTAGSPRLREALSILSDFDALWVRDPESRDNIDKLGVSPPVILGSDLAFLSDAWCPPDLALKPKPSRATRPKLGVILRDWPSGSGEAFAQAIWPNLQTLQARFDLTLIALDVHTDDGTLSALSDLSQIVWRPDHMEIADFARVLADQDVLLTARAHGAICGACLGRASVILGIEPKLSAVHAMLPQATRFAAPTSDGATLARLIDEALTIPHDKIAADVQRNRDASQNALNQMLAMVDI